MKHQQVRESELYGLIVQVRSLFHGLARAADRLHADAGVTAAQRGVLELLADRGPATVSTMARRKQVTRQHIQGLVNRLLDGGLVETSENPAHRRSPLIGLTAEGRRAFTAVRKREGKLLRSLARELSEHDFGAVAHTLRTLGTCLDERSEG